MFRGYFGDVSGLFRGYFGDVPGMFRGSFPDIFWLILGLQNIAPLTLIRKCGACNTFLHAGCILLFGGLLFIICIDAIQQEGNNTEDEH